MWCAHIWKAVCRSQCATWSQGKCAYNREVCAHLPSHTQQLPLRGYETPVQQKKIIGGGVPHLDRADHVPRVPCVVAWAAGGGAIWHWKCATDTDMSSLRDLKKTLCTNSSCTKLFPHLRLLLRTFTGMYLYVSMLEIVLVNSPRAVLVIQDRRRSITGTSGLSFCVPSVDLLSFIIHCCFSRLESSLLRVRDPCCTCSRFASLTFLKDIQTLLYHNHGFPMASLTEQNPDFVFLSPRFHTREQFVLPRL